MFCLCYWTPPPPHTHTGWILMWGTTLHKQGFARDLLGLNKCVRLGVGGWMGGQAGRQ